MLALTKRWINWVEKSNARLQWELEPIERITTVYGALWLTFFLVLLLISALLIAVAIIVNPMVLAGLIAGVFVASPYLIAGIAVAAAALFVPAAGIIMAVPFFLKHGFHIGALVIGTPIAFIADLTVGLIKACTHCFRTVEVASQWRNREASQPMPVTAPRPTIGDSPAVANNAQQFFIDRDNPPDELQDLFSGELFKDPWTTPSGNTYEKENIVEWIERANRKDKVCLSPRTRNFLFKEDLKPNRALKDHIEQHTAPENNINNRANGRRSC